MAVRQSRLEGNSPIYACLPRVIVPFRLIASIIHLWAVEKDIYKTKYLIIKVTIIDFNLFYLGSLKSELLGEMEI